MGLRRYETYASIKRAILNGSYGLHQQLQVDQLARQYGLSKTPIREALHLLQAEGLVEIVPRVGYFTTTITVQEIADLFELRLILERNAGRLAAERISDAEQAGLDAMHGSYAMGDAATYLPWLEHNRRFHYDVAAAAHNHDLAETIGRVVDRLGRVHWRVLDLLPFAPADIQSHAAILEALRRRDPDAVAAAIVGHIRASRDAALKSILASPGSLTL